MIKIKDKDRVTFKDLEIGDTFVSNCDSGVIYSKIKHGTLESTGMNVIIFDTMTRKFGMGFINGSIDVIPVLIEDINLSVKKI